MDKRLKEINARLIDFSLGKFDRQITISKKRDELDGISNGINMLGEELNEVLISKNYYNSIFNSVSDMVFILEKSGRIADVNKAVEEKLLYSRKDLAGKNIQSVCKGFPLPEKKSNTNIAGPSLYEGNPAIRNSNGNYIPVRVSLSHFDDTTKKHFDVFTATDISSEIVQENVRIRTIIDAQEKERQRIAKDLHDTLIQQLAAIKFHINSNLSSLKNKSILADLQQSNEVLSSVIKETRNICFNLMPAILKEFGLIKAVREFSLLFKKQATFRIIEDTRLPRLSEELEIDLYRISQELISNSIQHGKASRISIRFSAGKNSFNVRYRDNGHGFDTGHYHKGMGLQNIHSRIKSQNGSCKQQTSVTGTQYSIMVPIFDELWHI